jgi:hypothetical protein
MAEGGDGYKELDLLELSGVPENDRPVSHW